MRRKPAHPRLAQGSALVFILIILMAGAAFLVSALRSNPQVERDKITADVLAKAKDLLIGQAVSRSAAGERPGDLIWPDSFGGTETPPNYDGKADGGCMDSTSANGLPLIASTQNMRCIGRLPWVDLKMSIVHAEENDPVGIMPWYVVSANLVDTGCLGILNSDVITLPQPTLNADATRSYLPPTCSATNVLPHPWLTVRNATGTVISNRVAAVIIIPGPALLGQPRPSSPNLVGPSAYLDSITISDTTYSNADLDNDFIQAQPSDTFNDKLLFITIDELMAAVEKHVAAEAGNTLRTFYNTCGFYPKPVNFLDNSCYTGTCASDTGLTQGRFPSSAAVTYSGWSLPLWFSENRWDTVLYYAISDGFKSGGDGATLLSVDGSASARALFFTPASNAPPINRVTAPNVLGNYLLTAENSNLDTAFIFNNTSERGYQRKDDPSGYSPSSPNPICGCAATTFSWAVGTSNCSAPISARLDGSEIALTSTASGTTGAVTARCNVSTWQASSPPPPTCSGTATGPTVSFSDSTQFSQFEPVGSGVTVDPATQTAHIDVAGGSGGGCFWFPNPLTINGKILRAFYEFQFKEPDPPGGADLGYGFTFSLLEGDMGKPTICSSQSRMGVLPASDYPFSLFVETDIHDGSTGETAPNHTAIMANGNISHSATNGNLTATCNGTAAGCNHSPSNKFEENPNPLWHNQRVEIHSGYDSTCTTSGGGTYSRVRVWVDCLACTDTAADFTSTPTVRRCINLNSSMNDVYFGFTAGFASSGGNVQGVAIKSLNLRVE